MVLGKSKKEMEHIDEGKSDICFFKTVEPNVAGKRTMTMKRTEKNGKTSMLTEGNEMNANLNHKMN
jgi:hypothetical protein